MATKEKKLSIGRKQQTSSPIPPKESTPPTQTDVKMKSETTEENKPTPKTPQSKATTKTPLVKKLEKTKTNKKVGKKPSLAIQLKPKKSKPIKVSQNLAKSLLNSAKNLEAKKKLLNNGTKQVRARKRKPKEEKNEDDGPPVLEPILPLEVTAKKRRKRISKKAPNITEGEPKIDADKVVSGPDSVTKQRRRPKPQVKKIKLEDGADALTAPAETIEEVMNDLSFLIKKEEIKTEPDNISESSKSDSFKPKKLIKRQKLEMLKKKIKKEDIENTLNKLGPSERKVIDMLDLNVRKLKKAFPLQRRRHSIEKFPIEHFENADNVIAQFRLFRNLPRSISPRSKRAKTRQSVDGVKRSSPYTTRSDSLTRILRNGKHRKLKDLNLLTGVEGYKRQRRLCSDLSGSELSFSKMSGYESDSSFSDFSSLHGTDFSDSKELDIKVEPKDDPSDFDVSTTKIDVNPTKIDVNPTKMDMNPTKIDVNPTKIDVNPTKIDVNPTKIDVNPTKIDVNPTKIDVKPTKIDVKPTKVDASPAEIINSAKVSMSPAKIKRSISSESATSKPSITDTNSNLYEIVTDTVKSDPDNSDAIAVNPSTKVPEKSLILDIMKQAFNEKKEEKKETCENAERKEIVDNSTYKTDLASKNDINRELETDKIVDELDTKEQESKTTEEEKMSEIISKIVETMDKDLSAEMNGELEMDIEPEKSLSNNIENKCDSEDLVSIGNIPSDNSKSIVELATELEELNSHTYTIETPESAEEKARKESILKALGLQSLEAAEEAKKEKTKPFPRSDYTGTLKTVIKLNREKKKGRNSLKMTLQKNKSKDADVSGDDGYKIMKEGTSSNWKHGGNQSSDTAGAHRKSHYSNRSNLDGSSEHTSDGETQNQEGPTKALVIPEKASSFSIHPGRLCKDECSYCFGKFGLFDTPCHIAQMKSVERQDKILATEKHLTRDSCLCDACYRHVDRKSNTPSYVNKSFKRGPLVAPGPRENHCHVLGCNKVSTKILRRKWIIKMRKSICQVINIDLDNPGLHSIPICEEHYVALEHLMVCAMCKRRLARNHIHYIGPEINDLNEALNKEGIPLGLTDKPVVCKLCKCFATVILKEPEDRPENCSNFFTEYKKRLLHFNNIVPMDEAAAEEPITVPTKERCGEKELPKKKKKLSKNQNEEQPESPSEPDQKPDQNRVPSIDSQSRPESPSDYMVDYNTLIPSIAMECGSDPETNKEKPKKTMLRKIPKLDSVKEAVEISKKLKHDSRNSDMAVQRLGSNPSISVRQLFPGEEDLALQGHIDFCNVKEKTPEGWEKCSSIIQYDKETKLLWQELQKPYGNQSSFLRHLILLEKYFRNGDLELSPNASHHSVNYSESVQSRLRAYDNIPSSAGKVQPISMMPFNKSPLKTSGGGILSTNAKELPPATLLTPTVSIAPEKCNPVTITPVTNPAVSGTNIATLPIPTPGATIIKTKSPPGLISLHPGTTRPVAPLVKMQPQPQKIKFPITKNWRPNLIPIDPTKPIEKKSGLVQVISGGKPFHITLEDYKKMCAIKRSFELRQKKLQEAQQSRLLNAAQKPTSPKKQFAIAKVTQAETKTDMMESESILEKLDQTVENLESKLNDTKSLQLPKIPKSLTVIPQTVSRKTSRPSSPGLVITAKQKQNSNKS